MSTYSFFDHFFFALIALIIPFLSLMRGKIEFEEVIIKDKKKFYYTNGGVLWIGAVAVILLWLMGGRSWGLLGINWPILTSLVIGLTVLFIMTYLIEMISELKREDSETNVIEAAPFLPETWADLFHFSFLAISAGICEEVVYRGFLVNYLYGLFMDPVTSYNIAVIFPAFVFGIVHMYQGFKSVLKIMVMSLLFGTIFILSESLLIVILLHVGVDMAGGFIGMKLNQTALNERKLNAINKHSETE